MGHPGMQQALKAEQVKEEIQRLKSENKTMVLATRTVNGQAEVSYLPYIYFNNKYFIVLTRSSSHYENITETKAFQGMILESEQAAVSTFFRKRIIFNLMYQKVNEAEEIVQQFMTEHGPLVKQVLSMNFNIFELKLVDGRVILGPAQAYALDENENVTEQIVKGH